MAIRVALHHKTSYLYDRPVTLEPHLIRLRPAPHCRTPVLSYSLRVTPEEHFINWQQDPYGNYQARLVFPEPSRRLDVEVDLVADMAVINPFDFFIDSRAEEFPFEYDELEQKELAPYREVREAGPQLTELVKSWRRPPTKTVDYLVELNRDLAERISYLIRLEPGIQSCEETLEKKSGSCRDTSWLLVQALRHLGFAARFTSGYLIQLTPDEKAVDGPSGPSQDFTDLHAWTEVYLPGAGWVGLDATSGLLAGEGHLPLACAADPLTASPISGSFAFRPVSEDDRVEENFEFSMSVQRIRQPARVTLPYDEPQWQRLMQFGEQLDERLQRQDLRLTMGGEPTFVSVHARDDAQWNTAALGREKRELAGLLLRRLRDKFAPQGLLHFGQGKQYPGESLPRWALSCLWRRDGEPIWQDSRWEGDEAVDYGFGIAEAERFTHKLLERLGLPVEQVQPAYEDPYYYLWKEGQLPANVDPLDNRLEDAEERARIRRVFEQGLGRKIGLAIPMQYQQGFYTGPWSLRRGHLFLIPGDSAMGFRLPLDSLPWSTPEQHPDLGPRDYFGELEPLPRPQQVIRKEAPPEMGFVQALRTALCVEPREGRLYLFVPPLPSTDAFVQLVNVIEATAAELEMPVLLEGYCPDGDPRLNSFAITPDPGVLEVNIHPSASWSELASKTETIYEEARQVGLAAEKFALDGRHVGTGGGNHILLGGPTPAD